MIAKAMSGTTESPTQFQIDLATWNRGGAGLGQPFWI
jgi:hypothetical protein